MTKYQRNKLTSPSPTHLLVKADAEILKNDASLAVATAFAKRVLPVPGGPNNKTPIVSSSKSQKEEMENNERQILHKPFGGALNPVKISGRKEGRITASIKVCFAKVSPAIVSQCTPGD